MHVKFYPNLMVSFSLERILCAVTIELLTGTYHWYQSFITIASNKKRIEVLEAGLDGVQEGMQRIELTCV